MKFRRAHAVALSATLLLVLSACGGDGESRIPSSGNPEADARAEQRIGADGKGGDVRTLYERIGGSEMIAAIVDDMTERVIADPRVNFERKNVKSGWFGGKYKAWDPSPANIDRFKLHTIEFLTLAAGGPSEYTGRDLRTVHAGMKISNVEFDAMVGDIKATMDKLEIGNREKRDLLAIIETTRKQIVENR